jgi:cyclophilin family peptidyl-prolyl cis-trans isomerase
MFVFALFTACNGATFKAGQKMKEEDLKKGNPIIEMKTTMGTIKLELFADVAPKHAWNFVKLSQDTFYNGLLFHRVIKNFMIQTGDPEGTGAGGPGYNIDAEISNLKHTRGTLAAARQGDQVNPKRASSGSQFYICQVDCPHLDNQYTIFGHVTEGLDVVDLIGNTKTGPRDKPVEDIKIISMKVIGLKDRAATPANATPAK